MADISIHPTLLNGYAELAADGELVTLVAGKEICLCAMVATISTGTATIYLKSGSTQIGATHVIGPGSGFVLPGIMPDNETQCWKSTVAGEALNLDVAGTTAVAVDFVYFTRTP